MTLLERMLGLMRLPYPIACIIGGCILGPPIFFVLYFLDSLSLDRAVKQESASAFFSIGQFGQPLPVAQGLAVAVLYTVFLILTLYFVRYMRVNASKLESYLGRLNPEYNGKLSGANATFAVLFAVGFSLVYGTPRILGAKGFFSLLSAVVFLPLDSLAIGVGLSVYFGSLWAVYKFGSGPLKLVPYHQDRMLGLHPIGSMVLSFGIVYLLLDGIAWAGGLLSGDFLNLQVLVGLLVLLAVMLYLPVYGIHKKMILEKSREKMELQARIAGIVSAGGDASQDDEKRVLSDVRYLLAYRTLRAEVAKIPTWPFETGRLERFIAVFLSITAILIARLIQVAFHF